MVQLTSYLKVEISGSVPILSSVTQTHSILLLLHYQHVGFQYLCLRLDSTKIAAIAPNIMSFQQHRQHKRRGRLFTNKLSLHISNLWLRSKGFLGRHAADYPLAKIETHGHILALQKKMQLSLLVQIICCSHIGLPYQNTIDQVA